MDGNAPDASMRASAGLGTCNCCDYFTFLDAALVLIEETRLRCQIRALRSDFAQDLRRNIAELDDHDWKRVTQRILRRLSQENKLKVYGSLLVLCRLAKVLDGSSAGGAEALGRRASYWIVDSEPVRGDDAIFFDQLTSKLNQDLRGALTSQVVDRVEVLPVERLGARLPASPLPVGAD